MSAPPEVGRMAAWAFRRAAALPGFERAATADSGKVVVGGSASRGEFGRASPRSSLGAPSQTPPGNFPGPPFLAPRATSGRPAPDAPRARVNVVSLGCRTESP